MFRMLAVVFLLLFAAACSGPVLKGESLDNRAVTLVAAPAIQPEYQIQVGDNLDIRFFYNRDLNESVTVRPDGRISLQLVHDIMAAGKTADDLTQVLVEKYDPIIARPEITVIVKTFSSQRIFVDGEVTRPGIIPLTAPMTLLESIAAAGGLKDTARVREVIIIRKGPDNRPSAMTADVEKALDGSDLGQNVMLAASDIVYVPKSAIANVNKWVDQYIRKNIPIGTGFGYSVVP